MSGNRKVEKVGIIGGTFNPIHVGHLILAQNAMNQCSLDKVLFIPAGVSYFKNPEEVVSVQHRLMMTSLAIKGNDSFELSTVETDREGNSYTYETLEILAQQNPNTCYYFIVGADTIFKMDTWKCPEKVFENCIVCCQKRDNYSSIDISARIQYLEEKYNARIELMDIPEVQISSTFIRNSIKKGDNVRYYLGNDVYSYIKDNKLYS